MRELWVVPALMASAVLAPVFIRFARDLPSAVKARLGVGAAVYGSGAVGPELAEGMIDGDERAQELARAVLTGIQETMELVGVSLVLLALLAALSLQGVVLRFAGADASDGLSPASPRSGAG